MCVYLYCKFITIIIKLSFNVYFSICFFSSKKTINTNLKLEIRFVCREFLTFKYLLKYFFFRNKSDDYFYLYIRNLLNSRFVHNIHLCWQVENTKRILCCQKMVLNVQYLRFRMYKVVFKAFRPRTKSTLIYLWRKEFL